MTEDDLIEMFGLEWVDYVDYLNHCDSGGEVKWSLSVK
jgi:hypothetical protein